MQSKTKHIQIIEVNKPEIYVAFSSDGDKWTNLHLDYDTFTWITGMYDLNGPATLEVETRIK